MPDDPDDSLPRDTIAVEPAAVATIQITPNARIPAGPTDLWSGEHEKSAFGRFEIIDVIGAGGMGVVLSAQDPQLDRKVAIKVLRTRGMTGDRRRREAERLLREARALAQLSHPNVVTVYEAGTIDERVFIAMELIDGHSLRAWQSTRDKAAILDVYIKAGRGLAAGHAAGIVHRDFKPDNVLIGRDGRVRVIDFGLAQPGRAATETEITEVPVPGSRVTFETTTSFGTPVYMSPEQHNRDKADARADQFAFCVALYEALFGKLPFAGTTYGELVMNVTGGHVATPPAGVVPAPIVAAIRRGLSTDPSARFPTMDALLDAIQPAPPRKRTGLPLAIVGGVVAVAVGATLAIVKLTEEPAANPCEGGGARLAGVWDDGTRAKVKASFAATPRTHAAASFDRAAAGLDAYATDWVTRQRDVCEATNVRHERSEAALDAGTSCLAGRLDQLRALTSLLATADAEVVDHAVSAIDALPPLAACTTVTTVAATSPLDAKASAMVEDLEVGKPTRAIELAKPLLAEASNSPAGGANLYLEYGSALAHTGHSAEAEAALHEATRLAAIAKDDLVAARAWVELVEVVGFAEARYDDGLALVAVAEVAIQRADADKDIGGDLAYYLGIVEYAKGAYDKARASFEKARDRFIARYGENHPRVATAINSLGGARLSAGDAAGARKDFEHALAIYDKVLGPGHPDSALALSNLGAVAKQQGDLDAAIAYGERALAILQDVDGHDSINVGLALSNLGGFVITRMDWAKADDYFTRALAVFDKIDPDNPRVVLPLIMRAEARDGLNQHPASVADAERALAIVARGKLDPAEVADAKFTAADVMWDAGLDHARCLALMLEAQKMYTEQGEPAKSKLIVTTLWLAGHH